MLQTQDVSVNSVSMNKSIWLLWIRTVHRNALGGDNSTLLSSTTKMQVRKGGMLRAWENEVVGY
jgi:hypothetical protein